MGETVVTNFGKYYNFKFKIHPILNGDKLLFLCPTLCDPAQIALIKIPKFCISDSWFCRGNHVERAGQQEASFF